MNLRAAIAQMTFQWDISDREEKLAQKDILDLFRIWALEMVGEDTGTKFWEQEKNDFIHGCNKAKDGIRQRIEEATKDTAEGGGK